MLLDQKMSPEYLHRLADIADPKQLWSLSGLDQMKLSEKETQELDTGQFRYFGVGFLIVAAALRAPYWLQWFRK